MKLNARRIPPKRKNDSVSFRTTTEKRERLEEAAMNAGMTLSTFLDAVTDERMMELKSKLTQMQRPAPAPQYRRLPPDLVEQFIRIGNNLNQIAHAANADLPPQLRYAAQTLKAILDLIIENDLSPNPDAARQMADLVTRMLSSQTKTPRSPRPPRYQSVPAQEPKFDATHAPQAAPPYGEFSTQVPLRHQRPWKTDKK